MSDDLTVKSFWEKPEGKVGMIVLAGLIGGGGLVVWYFLLPILITLIANTLIFGALATVLVALVMFLMNPNIRALIAYGYKRAIYNTVNAVYKIDPIGILRVAVMQMRDRVAKLREIRKVLKDQIKINARIIEANDRDHRNAKQELQSAQSNYDVYLKSRQAKRSEKSNVSYRDMQQKLLRVEGMLDKCIKTISTIATDCSSEADTQERDRKQLMRSHNILKNAVTAIANQERDMAMFNKGIEVLLDERLQLTSEIDSLTEMISEAVMSLDLGTGTFDEGAMDKFDAWERKADALLLGPGDQHLLSSALDATPPQREHARLPSRRSSYFED